MNRERNYQRQPRFTKRLEVTFTAGGLTFRGILSNISENGLFIRTNRGFAPGTTLDLELVMPDNRIAPLKGVVKRTIKSPLTTFKNGMGVELTQTDERYKSFVRSLGNEERTSSEPQFEIISCPSCGVKNKVLQEKIYLGPKCGKCKAPLVVAMS